MVPTPPEHCWSVWVFQRYLNSHVTRGSLSITTVFCAIILVVTIDLNRWPTFTASTTPMLHQSCYDCTLCLILDGGNWASVSTKSISLSIPHLDFRSYTVNSWVQVIIKCSDWNKRFTVVVRVVWVMCILFNLIIFIFFSLLPIIRYMYLLCFYIQPWTY